MNHISTHINKVIKLILIVLVVPLVSFAQAGDDKTELNKELEDLLGKYMYLIGSIKPDVQMDPVRPFVLLFRNAKVEVYNDLDPEPATDMISVREYGEKIKKLYPDGITCQIDLENKKLGKLPDIEGGRMVVEVKVRRVIEGTLNGEKFRKSEKLIFLIGYDFSDDKYENFLIHGISLVTGHEHELTMAFSPSYTMISNKNISSDSRFEIPWERSWRAGINYQYMVDQSWGIGTGINLLVNTHSLLLDKIDPLKGHDPNLTDIRWSGELTYLEIPFYGLYHYQLGRRMIVEVCGGGFAGYRIFEDIQTEGTNFHSGELLTGVVSDPFNYENIVSYDLGIEMTFGLKCNLGKRFGLIGQLGYKQGLVTLEKNLGIDLPYQIYQGQYNPLFYKSGSPDFSRAWLLKMGITFSINGDKYYN